MIIASAATVVGVLPMYLTGALAVNLTEDLSFGASGLGLAIAIFRATGAFTAIHMGRLVDGLGAIWSLRIAALVASFAAFGIAATTSTWLSLVGWLMLGGVANTLSQPAANRLVVNRVSVRRQGLAFGIKQSAPPLAAMAAGLMVPTVAALFGWRSAFGLTAILALGVILVIGQRPPSAQRVSVANRGRTRLLHPKLIVALAASFGVATAASSVVPAFFMTSAVDAGMKQSTAGVILAIASGAAIGIRLIGGVAADRMSAGHLRLCSIMLAVGSVGLLLLSSGTPSVMAVGVIIALMGTWGINGIFIYSVVRKYSYAPGAVTGALMPGSLIGAALGPALFGIGVDAFSYAEPWRIASGVAVAASVMMFAGARYLDK